MPSQTDSRSLVLALFLVIVLPGRALADEGPASLLIDLAETPDAAAGLDPRWLTAVGDQLFFSGRSPLAGRELWTSDGTPEGTGMVTDACPGSCSGVSRPIVALADAVYFEACDTAPTCQLWRSDGTSQGTVPVTRLSRSGSAIRHLTGWNGALYFEACDVTHGCELYRSDGTPEGTHLLADVAPGPADARINDSSVIHGLTVAGDRLFFTASDDHEVWTSDGTAAGTRRLRHLTTSSVSYQGIVGTETRAFFVVDFFELWTSDGTVAGTRRVLDRGHIVDPLAAYSDQLFFSSLSGGRGRELWISDGTAAGTRLVKDGFDVMPFPGLAFRDDLYFGVGSQLWKSDGTPEGTVRVADLGDTILDAATDRETLYVGTRSALWKLDAAGGASLVSGDASARWLEPFRGGVAFAAAGDAAGSELAVSSGPGATRVTDLVDPGSSHPTGLTAHRGTLLFSSFADPAELYQSREAAPPVRRLGSFDVRPVQVSAGGKAFVMGDDLWTIGPGGELVMLLEGERFGSAGVDPLLRETAVAFAGRLTFLVWNFVTDHIELWTSDGTVAGTRQLDELMSYRFCFICDPPFPLPKSGAVVAGDRLYVHFAGFLWVTDGGEGHAIDLGAGCRDCDIGPAAAVGKRLFFATARYDRPLRLWVSDGTEAGTSIVRQLDPAHGGAPPLRVGEFRGLAGRLYFVFEDPVLGEELWASDGTDAGTVTVSDLRPGAGSSNPRDLTVLGGRLYFSADDGVRGRELWTSDGSVQGTRLVADLRPGAAGSQPAELAAIGGRLYFSADDGVHGRELWTSDGSARGTRMLQDIQPGPLPSSPASFTAAGSRIYFAAGTAAEGFELWAMPRGPSCESCLLDDRFVVSVEWRHGGVEGAAHPAPLPDAALSDTTLPFWFFSSDNVELFVKMLDGRGQNGHFWVFYGGLTDVGYRIRIEDRETGAIRIYDHPPGDICGRGDTGAFPASGAASPAGISALRRVDLEPRPAEDSGPCVPGPGALCLLGGRFRVAAGWTNQHAGGVTGPGRAVPGTDETGYFWFFSRNNLELAVKVLDGRSINGRFWVFYGALTDVEYRIEVTDTETGARRTYHNPPGEICGGADTSALVP